MAWYDSFGDFFGAIGDGASYVADGVSDLFTSDAPSAVADVVPDEGSSFDLGDVAGALTKPAEDTGSSFFGDLGSALLSKEGITGLLGAGSTYLSLNQKANADAQLYKRQQEGERFKALMELEKLKHSLATKGAGGGRSGGGGGGNSGAQDRATLISALASAKGGQSNGYANLSQTLSGAYK